jgi:uncharacterized membrane protein HdeD (DUF308 family)
MEQKKRIQLQTRVLALVCMLFGGLAILSPIYPGGDVASHVGGLCVWVGIIEIYHAFKRNKRWSRRNAMYSGGFSIFIVVILINSIYFQLHALRLMIAIVFALESLRYFRNHVRQFYHTGRRNSFDLWAGIGNALLILGIFFLHGKGIMWVVAPIMGFRLIGIGLSLLAAPTGTLDQVSEDVVSDLGFEHDSMLAGIAQEIEDEEVKRAPYDRRWIMLFIVILFVIHLGRMGFDRSYLGILSPLVATIGDIVIALIITYLILWPLRMGFKKLSLWIDRRLWAWVLKPTERKGVTKGLEKVVQYMLTRRIRALIQFRKAGYSLRTALRTGLRMGLPWAALLAAIIPVLGMSWYFDTENWASGIWDRWAALRADSWRVSMIKATGANVQDPNTFLLKPQGVESGQDFSFVVLGDPGEGDPSQLILKDQILKVTEQPEVKFMFISSDIIYPSGALKDYERKFWLVYKGVTKPVYAIPGNHDWYDALEGFNATFLTPDMAKRAMKARLNADLNISSTNYRRIDEMLKQTKEWQAEYGIPTGFQEAPFFQVGTDEFVMITLETGVERQIDSLQLTWLKTVLDRSKDKFVMVVLGHPLYAIGEYQGEMNPEFVKLHQLLRAYKVPLVMAGDTHDFEYYKELPQNGDGHTMHHFVNGGGGAYLSFGAAFTDPAKMPTDDYAFYPTKAQLMQKVEKHTSWYKYPLWWYTKKFDAWPFSTEWLSAAFDYNSAPFFQSFCEVKVETSQNRVRVIPYSNHGRLRWRDMTATAGSMPPGASVDDFAEWVFPMR